MKLYVTVAMLALCLVGLRAQLCVNSEDCAPSRCCIMGHYQQSRGNCNDLVAKGNNCRPGNTPYNTTVHYQNGEIVNYTNIYNGVCPCASGLHCSSETQGTCQIA